MFCHVGIHVILGALDLGLGLRKLGPHVKWQGPISMLSMVEIAHIDHKVTWGLGLGTVCELALI